MNYTITLTEEEFGMLVTATNLVSMKYRHPRMSERTQEAGRAYGDLCNKLYYSMIQQNYESQE